jgi:hypothetical protein
MDLTLALVWLLISGLFIGLTAMLGFSLDASDFVQPLATGALAAAAAGTGAIVGARRNPGWVRASAAGLEFAMTNCKPVFLPWAAVQSVRLRLIGPLTELVVTPTSPDAASVAPLPGWPPRLRRRFSAPSFTVDVGMMTPRPGVLLAELNRRRATHG